MYTCLNAGAVGVKLPFEELIEVAKRAGFAGIDTNVQELAELAASCGTAELRATMAEAGLRFGSSGLPVRWNGSEADYKEDMKTLPRLARAAGEIGATRFSQWIPSASHTRKFRENFRWHVERLRPIAEVLGEYGCRLGLEFLGPRHFRVDGAYGFICTAAGMLALCEAIGTGNLGLLLDAFHWYTSYGTIADLMAMDNDDIVNVHINDAVPGVAPADQIDNKRALPGETGVIDLAGFIKSLDAARYDGPVAAEPFSPRLHEMPAEEAVKVTYDSLAAQWRAAGIS